MMAMLAYLSAPWSLRVILERRYDQHSTEVSSNLEPGGIEYFKIECGCKGSPAADHDSFKLKITNAY
jgi:hypothetical protein